MTEQLDILKLMELADNLYHKGCKWRDYDPRGQVAWQELIDYVEKYTKNTYPKYSLYIDQPIPTVTQEMVDSAQSVAWNTDQDWKVLMEQYLQQHDWIHNYMGVNDDSLWLHSKTMQKYSNVEDAYDEQLDMEKYG